MGVCLMVVYLYGWVSVCLYGCMSVLLYVCIMYGCMSGWVYVCMYGCMNISPAGEQSYNRSDRYGNLQFCTLVNKHIRTGTHIIPVLYLS